MRPPTQRTHTIERALDTSESQSAPAPARSAAPSRRVRIAEWLAFGSLVAAFIGAIGPADEVRTTYTWPPRVLPNGQPTQDWYTPLLVATRAPEAVTAIVPCGSARAAAAPQSPVTLLATSRVPRSTGGLALTDAGRELVVTIGDKLVTRASLAPTRLDLSACAYRLTIEDDAWTLDGGPTRRTRTGDLPRMPVVNGLFSEADLRDATRPSIAVTTRVHDTRATAIQAAAWTVAALTALLALFVVASDGRRGVRRFEAGRVFKAAVARAGAVDASVVLGLVAWWILAPAFFDDGWAVARQRALSTAGEFSNYFEPYGASLPLGYWHDWVFHWLTDATDQLAMQRLPTLGCLVATWFLTRWAFALTTRRASSERGTTWALGVAFVVVSMAWGMSLRQEPAVAVLLGVVIVCSARFVTTGSTAPLAVAAAAIPLSLTVHPAGVVALAPLLAVTPSVFRWLRSFPAAAVALLAAGGALTLTLGFIGSDVEHRALDANAIGHGATTGSVGWRNELVRYSVLALPRADDLTGYGTPLRRGSVVLMLLAAVAVLAFHRRFRTPLNAIAAYTLPLALMLLVLTPRSGRGISARWWGR